MDAVMSFFRDAWNWVICILLIGIFAILWLIRAEEDEEQPTPAVPVPPPTPTTPPPTLADWSTRPAQVQEARAFVTSLPADALVELDDSGAEFTVAEVERLVAVWERAAH